MLYTIRIELVDNIHIETAIIKFYYCINAVVSCPPPPSLPPPATNIFYSSTLLLLRFNLSFTNCSSIGYPYHLLESLDLVVSVQLSRFCNPPFSPFVWQGSLAQLSLSSPLLDRLLLSRELLLLRPLSQLLSLYLAPFPFIFSAEIVQSLSPKMNPHQQNKVDISVSLGSWPPTP